MPAPEQNTVATVTVTPTPSEGAGDTVLIDETPVLPKAALKLLPHDQHKMLVLMQILSSKNDNDRRMDTDLIDLSPELKHAMEAYYHEIPSEKRNDRGTIVFLISRKITEKSDLDFLKSVLLEKPCLSLSDCSKAASAPMGDAAHLEGINETTANYPQLMAIRELTEQYRETSASGSGGNGVASKILETLKDAAHSPNPKVVYDAERAVHYLTGR